MPSTFTTDPIGPRSVDEMLGVVYGRAAVLQRRRTVQRVGAGIAAVVLAVAGALTLQGSDEGAQVRVVDERGQDAEEALQQQPEAQAAGPGQSPGPSTAPKPSAAPGRPPSSVPKKAGVTTTVPAVVAQPQPQVETWKAVTDTAGDSTPRDWYYDITAAAMEYDPQRREVVFTTRYRAPSGSTGSRQSRKLESEFAYDTGSYLVTVEESGDRLGTVTLDEVVDCPECTAAFDPVQARLVVRVPLKNMNAEIARNTDSPALGAGAEITSLIATTTAASAGPSGIDADTATRGAS